MKSRYTCPSCRAVLEFDRTEISVVKCPNCKYTGNVSNFKEKAPETEIPGNPMTGKIYRPGKLEFFESDVKWLHNDKTVNLNRGVNKLGRMSNDSTASIQLPTEDSFMSRNHAVIDVVMKTDGVFEHRLSNLESKNGTFLNGIRLEKDEKIILLPGDIIKLGHTFFKFIAE